MGFRLFLTDELETAELDVDNIQNNTLISLLDINDLNLRKNPIQSLVIKGTKNNNYIFGQFFDLSNSTNDGLENKLYFNYNPLRAVKCLLYEDSELIFVGSLRLSEFEIDKNGESQYSCIVTTALTELKNILQEKLLSDIDFTDLRHRYKIETVYKSWSESCETYNRFTNQFNQEPFEYGKNYVYPYIDYGYRFLPDSGGEQLNFDVDNWNFQNFKPAVYLKEYLKRIFSLQELSGYTYEVRGFDDFINQFNRVIVPDTRESMADKIQGFTTIATLVTGSTLNGYTPFDVTINGSNLVTNIFRTIPCTRIVHADRNITGLGWFYLQNSGDNKLRVLKTFKTNWRLVVNGNVNVRPVFEEVIMKIILYNNDNIIGEVTKNFVNDGQPTPFSFDKTFADYQVEAGSQVYAKVVFYPKDGNFNNISPFSTVPLITYSINQCDIYCPATELSQFVYEPNYTQAIVSVPSGTTVINIPSPGPGQDAPVYVFINRTYRYNIYDFVKPSAPEGIKIIDFLKTVINQFNMVVYSTNDNYKHLIFEEYDSFYRFCTPTNFINNALDWTNKVDYTSGFKAKSNLNIPKSYNFTYKTDNDYLTKQYQDKFNDVYGNFKFADEYGLTAEKKIELITSPTVIANINGGDRVLPLLYQVDNGEIKKMKSNVRLMYYNSLLPCQSYIVRSQYLRFYTDDSIIQNSIKVLTVPEQYQNLYPQVSNYLITSGATNQVVQNIHFNEAKEVYFNYTDDYQNSPNSYSLYYIQSITDITNLNLVYVEANILLSAVDIANLDLRIPVYIQTGKNNGAYFKVLKVEYQEKDSPSQVLLQKIAF